MNPLRPYLIQFGILLCFAGRNTAALSLKAYSQTFTGWWNSLTAKLHKGQPYIHIFPSFTPNPQNAASHCTFFCGSLCDDSAVILDMSPFISHILRLMTSLDDGRLYIRSASEKLSELSFLQEQRRLLSSAHLNPWALCIWIQYLHNYFERH